MLNEAAQVVLKKPFQEFVIYLKEKDKRYFHTPNDLAKWYFEANLEFPLINGKNREYYETILIEEALLKSFM